MLWEIRFYFPNDEVSARNLAKRVTAVTGREIAVRSYVDWKGQAAAWHRGALGRHVVDPKPALDGHNRRRQEQEPSNRPDSIAGLPASNDCRDRNHGDRHNGDRHSLPARALLRCCASTSRSSPLRRKPLA